MLCFEADSTTAAKGLDTELQTKTSTCL